MSSVLEDLDGAHLAGLAVVVRLQLRRDERLPEREERWGLRFGLCALVGRRDPKRLRTTGERASSVRNPKGPLPPQESVELSVSNRATMQPHEPLTKPRRQ